MAVQYHSSQPTVLSIAGGLATLPIRMLLAAIEWVLFDVIARICSWVIGFPLAI